MNEIKEENVKEEVVIEKYNVKSWFKSSFLGFFIGLAVIVPGISGSTFAIIFKLYDKMIYAMSNIFKKFVTCFLFLLPIMVGLLIGVLVGFVSVKQLLVYIPFALVCLFAGFMIGSTPGVTDEVKDSKVNPLRITLLIIGVLIPVLISVLSTTFQVKGAENFGTEIPVWEYFVCLALGFVVAITQLVPGLSATAFLMSVGYFQKIINSVSLTYIKSTPMVLLIFTCLVIGFVVGLLVVSKVISIIFAKARTSAFYMIIGFVIGSIFVMFYNPDILEVYKGFAEGNGVALNVGLGVPFLAIGIICSYLFVRYERKQKTA